MRHSFFFLFWLRLCSFIQKSLEATVALLEKSKEEYVKMIESNDLCLEELSRVKALQAEKLESFKATTQKLQSSLALELQR